MPAKKVYTCTVCGKEGFWDKNWSFYGSVVHTESCPKDLIYYCSKGCHKTAIEKVKNKEWGLPVINRYGFIVMERKGY
jgi:hypothetical protein